MITHFIARNYVCFNFIIIAAGLLMSRVLFYRFPKLTSGRLIAEPSDVSIVIPARNEADNLPLLMNDLKNQTLKVHEIICVDDESTDDTVQIAEAYGIKVISVTSKPHDWMGKSWACQQGAEEASGEVLLFLDADVRLSSDGLEKLIGTYERSHCVISVQPYHKMIRYYEQCSIFFNIIQIAANGVCLPFQNKSAGLFGPVILIPKEDYWAIGGHTSAKDSMVEDLALGDKLKQSNIKYQLFPGGEDIAFRMYGDGLKSLMHGWIKNFAIGASKTPGMIFTMTFLWISSCISTFMSLILSLLAADLFQIILYALIYLIWVFVLLRISKHLGNFKKTVIFCYPFFLLVFVGIFMISVIKKIFHMQTIWKNRKIRVER